VCCDEIFCQIQSLEYELREAVALQLVAEVEKFELETELEEASEEWATERPAQYITAINHESQFPALTWYLFIKYSHWLCLIHSQTENIKNKIKTKSIESDTLTLDCCVLMGIASDKW
jgi:hypothetical protein